MQKTRFSVEFGEYAKLAQPLVNRIVLQYVHKAIPHPNIKCQCNNKQKAHPKLKFFHLNNEFPPKS